MDEKDKDKYIRDLEDALYNERVKNDKLESQCLKLIEQMKGLIQSKTEFDNKVQEILSEYLK